MVDNTLPRILTLQEIAEYLKTDETTISRELETGKLRGFRVGKEWRCIDEDLLAYIRGQFNRTGPSQINPKNIGINSTNMKITEIGSFDFNWPKKGGGNSIEHYEKGYEVSTNVDSQEYTFKVGFGSRRSAGIDRRRVTVWLGNRAIVEFAGSNDFENDGLLAGIIRLKNGKQLTTHKLPDEYKSFRIERYNSIVNGPRASTGMAVIVHKDDFKSMINHAIIRATWKDLIH
jgi:excisionase family DNA binding protein